MAHYPYYDFGVYIITTGIFKCCLLYTSNQGVELEINSKNIVSKDFDWSTSFTLSHNKNEIVKLDGEQTQIISCLLYTSRCV